MSSTSPYPFLTPHGSGHEYRSTQKGDLRLFLEAVRADITLIPKIKRIFLQEEYDGMVDSGILDFVDAYGLTTHGDSDSEDEVEEATVSFAADFDGVCVSC